MTSGFDTDYNWIQNIEPINNMIVAELYRVGRQQNSMVNQQNVSPECEICDL